MEAIAFSLRHAIWHSKPNPSLLKCLVISSLRWRYLNGAINCACCKEGGDHGSGLAHFGRLF